MEGPSASSESELRRIFAQSPEFVATGAFDGEWQMMNKRGFDYLESVLREQYEVVANIDGPVYRRRATPHN